MNFPRLSGRAARRPHARGASPRVEPVERRTLLAVSVGDASVIEGNSGTVDAVFTVTLDSPSSFPVTVDFATADGTATAGSDYVATSGQVVFQPGETSHTVAVPVIGDTVIEPDETFFLQLSNPVGDVIGRGQGVGTIINDDFVAADLSVTATAPTTPVRLCDTFDYVVVVTNNGPDGATGVVLTDLLPTGVTLVSFTTTQGTVTPNTGGLTADLGDLASGATATVTITVQPTAVGMPTNTATVEANEPDTDSENNTDSATATVVDPGILQFRAGTFTVNEAAGTATITVDRIGGTFGPVSVDFAAVAGTATAGADFTPVAGTLTFADGETSRTFTVPILDDLLDEPDETVLLSLSNSTACPGGTVAAVLTILDDDNPPTASIDDVSRLEGDAGTTDFVFTVTLSGPSGRPISIDFATADAGATAGSDYIATAGTLTFAPGVTSQTVRVAVVGDLVDEFDESFFVDLSNPSNVTLARPRGIGTILDDDVAAITVGDAQPVVEGNSGLTFAVFTVSTTRPSDREITVDYTTADGTATAGSDYVATRGTLTFLPGQGGMTVRVPVIGDNRAEGNETFFLVLSNPTVDNEPGGTFARSRATGTIIDDDSLSLSVADAQADEFNDPAIVTVVTLSAPSDFAVAVDYATADGTAVAGSDYAATAGTLTFQPGETSKTVRVPIIDNLVIEPDETLFLNLSNPRAVESGSESFPVVTLARASATLTIIDDELRNLVVVNTFDDGRPGSLRRALNIANASPGLNQITFAIPGAGPQVIRILTPLPTVNDPVLIDGYTQPGSRPNDAAQGTNAVIGVELDGGALPAQGSDGFGLVLNAGSSRVRGLAIHSFPLAGLALSVRGNNIVQGNFLGTDATGTRALGNGEGGVFVVDSSGNLIGGVNPAERNLISGNASVGVQILGNVDVTDSGRDEQFGTADDAIVNTDASRNQVFGNLIGTDPTGTRRLGNELDGVFVNNASANLIGVAFPGAGNLISGNGSVGVQVLGGRAAGNQIQGNLIGTDAGGNLGLGNARDGVFLNKAPGNLVGGAGTLARNFIGDNGFSGVDINGRGATGNVVANNAIGVGRNGGALGNRAYGVLIQNATGNTVGGALPNVIANNGFGAVQVIFGNQPADPTASGNLIGPNARSNNDRVLVTGGHTRRVRRPLRRAASVPARRVPAGPARQFAAIKPPARHLKAVRATVAQPGHGAA